jgi:hypothetical protein
MTPNYCSTLWDLFKIPRTFNLEKVWYKGLILQTLIQSFKYLETFDSEIVNALESLYVCFLGLLHIFLSPWEGVWSHAMPCLGLFLTHFLCFALTLFMIPRLRSQHEIWIKNFISCPTSIELISKSQANNKVVIKLEIISKYDSKKPSLKHAYLK